jgi:hypothetical protein
VRIVPPSRDLVVARGPGPPGLRVGLAVLAALYYLALLKHPPQVGPLRPIAFFTECTCLFPRASGSTIEYRLDGWSCSARAWQALDPRPYFPIESDDKESRFQRLGFFVALGLDTRDKHITENSRTVMHALEEYILGHHGEVDDTISGSLGGIRLFRVQRPIPEPGSAVARYVYDPLGLISDQHRKDLYSTRQSDRNRRCETGP